MLGGVLERKGKEKGKRGKKRGERKETDCLSRRQWRKMYGKQRLSPVTDVVGGFALLDFIRNLFAHKF